MVLAPLQLFIAQFDAQFDVLGSIPLRCMSFFLPSLTRSKWWSAALRHAIKLFYCALHSTLAGITGVSLLPSLFTTMS